MSVQITLMTGQMELCSDICPAIWKLFCGLFAYMILHQYIFLERSISIGMYVDNFFIFFSLSHFLSHSWCHKYSAPMDNYIIFSFFTFLGVAGVLTMLFIVPVKRKKVHLAMQAHYVLHDNICVYLLDSALAYRIPQWWVCVFVWYVFYGVVGITLKMECVL